MQASPELIHQWNILKEIGDNKKLSKILKIAEQNVSRILNTGEGSVSQIAKIQKFFKARKAEIEKIENELK